MAPIVTLVNGYNLQHSFASRPLFKGIGFSIEAGERVGLIGPNGAGKSTLLKIIAGELTPDQGTISLQKGLRLAYLKQNPPLDEEQTIEEAILSVSNDPHDWKEICRAQELQAKLSLDFENKKIKTLSGGWKKRVAIACELMKEPDLFLLDEPTNHLDVEGILWLEDFLETAPCATLTITHDRLFLQRISKRILELDPRNPQGMISIPGDYADYLETKNILMNNQIATEAKLQNTLRRETEWLRQGAKARTTKQQARIKRAGELKDQVEELEFRNQNKKTQMDFQGFEQSPKKLIEAKNISKNYDGVCVVPPMNLLIHPKSRIGLLGGNGSGKSTLIKILLGDISPDTGTVFHSEHLEVSYFEQNRESLDPDATVLRAVCPSGDFVDFAGRRMHVKGYLDRFLFRPEIFELPVKMLSGGEQSRLLLARLMLVRSNVLVLDEPTNDLDIQTLDVLQDVLSEYPGAVLLVSHDRYFMDQVSTEIYAFTHSEAMQKNKKVYKKEMVRFEGLLQWEVWYRQQQEIFKSTLKQDQNEKKEKNNQKKKFGFNEKKEFEEMESVIHKKEKKLSDLEAELQIPSVAENSQKVLELSEEMSVLQNEIDQLYQRWQELEAMNSNQ